MISVVIISGRSGSGKSTALKVLEDIGYYCIDNLPVTLLSPLIKRLEVETVDREMKLAKPCSTNKAPPNKQTIWLAIWQTSVPIGVVVGY